jgi:predicted PurR-regulated permease PerM
MLRQPTRFQQRTLWNAITGVALVVLGTLLVALVWLIGKVFGFLQPVLVPLAVAGIIAYLLDPLVRWLERRRMSRVWSVVTVYFGMLALMVVLAAVVIPGINRGRAAISRTLNPKPAATAASQGADKDEEEHYKLVSQLARSLDGMRTSHRDNLIGWSLAATDDAGAPLAEPGGPAPSNLDFFWKTRAGRFLLDYKGSILAMLHRWVSAGTDKFLGFLGLFIGMLMVPVYLFFFLKDSAAIRDHWHDFVPLKASRFKTELVETLQEINGYLISFFRGQVLVALIDGILVGIGLELYRLPYGFVIGVFMAILGIIPYIGNILCLIPACIIGWLNAESVAPFGLSPMGYVAGVLVIFITVQQINSLVTAPKIVGDSVGLHPMTVIFSMLFWSLVLGGFLGALLAVPMSASIKVLFRRYIWERQLMDASPDGDEAAET